MSDDDGPTVAVYADYVCPFCYLGRASLRAYEADREGPLDVDWRFFDLRGRKRGPDREIRDDVDDGKDEAYYDRVRENVGRLRERYGVEMRDLDDLPDGVDSWNAQQAALFVRRERDEGTFLAFHDALYDALWRDGRDIGDPDVLADVAAAVDLDPEAVRDAIDDAALADDLAAAFAAASERGISAVPTFVHDGYAARGAVPPEHLARLVEGA